MLLKNKKKEININILNIINYLFNYIIPTNIYN